MNDLKEMQGFDPNMSLAIDQSIIQDHELVSPRDAPIDKFSDQHSEDRYRHGSFNTDRSNSIGMKDKEFEEYRQE